jgi:uncharacterized membrane protein YhaH (DUF805 family)
MANTPAPGEFWKILFSLEGRIRRRTIWIGYAMIYGSLIGAWITASVIGGATAILIPVLYIGTRWCEIALLVKRMKDYNRAPGVYVFTVVIPVIGQLITLILLFEALLREGTIGPNRFGLDPKG